MILVICLSQTAQNHVFGGGVKCFKGAELRNLADE